MTIAIINLYFYPLGLVVVMTLWVYYIYIYDYLILFVVMNLVMTPQEYNSTVRASPATKMMSSPRDDQINLQSLGAYHPYETSLL